MQEDYVAANAADENAPQTSFATEDATPYGAENAAALPQDTQPAQSGPDTDTADYTRAFSQRLKTMSGQRVDDFVAGLGLTDPYRGDRPIRSQADYQSWLQARGTVQQDPVPGGESLQETAQLPPDPELGALQEEVRRLRADARDRDLLADPDQGPVYSALRGKVQQLLRAGEAAGQHFGTDAAYAAVLLRELPALQRQAADSASRQAMAAVQANSQASPGALGGPAAAAAPDFENMSSSEFAEYHSRALRGEWR